MASKTDIEDFLESPLVIWLKSCLQDPERLVDYDDIADGLVVYEVLLLIDPEPVHHNIGPSLGNPTLRTRNWDCIIRNVKALYEEELCQLVVILPDPGKLGRESDTKSGLEEMKLALQLLLGCAVQCPNKQVFIEKIKALPVEAQHSLVDCIKQVTESQEIVLTPEVSDSVAPEILIKHVRRLLKERDRLQLLACSDTRSLKKGDSSGNGASHSEELGAEARPGVSSSAQLHETQHLAVELADWKAKLRRQRQDLEEKSEALSEAKEELEANRALVAKLKNEVNELKTEARVGKAYRDEADALRERAERAERLETEVTRYRERLTDLDYYKSRVEELRQDKRVLEETREMLEDQLGRARARVEYTQELEARLLNLKQTINDLNLEREATQEKLQELFEENANLALLSKSAMNNDSSGKLDDNLDESSACGGEGTLSEQLSCNAQARALRLELENRRLTETVESLQENALLQTNERILQLEKDKKKLSHQLEEHEETKRKLLGQVSELEMTLKNAQRDNKKMQEIRDGVQSQLQLKIEEVESVSRDKGRWESRAKEAEERLVIKEKEADEADDLKNKISSLEKEIHRFKQLVEEKSTEIDRLHCLLDTNSKENVQLVLRLEEASSRLARLNEIEQKWKDLDSTYQVEKAALEKLQNDLVTEKMSNQQLKAGLESLGLAVDQLNDPDRALDKLLSNSEILKAVRERLQLPDSPVLSRPSSSELLQEENARLSVSVSTLQSQVESLSTQITAQKLANSQLGAEKEEILKRYETLREQHQQMLVDQLTLQRLHEQLSTQYETVCQERECARLEAKRVKAEHRELIEARKELTSQLNSAKAEIERVTVEGGSLANLRREHSKLKEDFKNLFTTSEKYKSEYRNLQEEYKKMKNELRNLSLVQTELQGEISAREDATRQLELEISRLSNDNHTLSQLAATFEEDRKSLMEHVTLLLGQYHSLLTHSLDDKEHYHMEEKIFSDKLNNLNRQKEKLEEKIMETYRNRESLPSKKKGFGASLVRRVRKAGSDFINKSRRSWHEEAVRRGVGGLTLSGGEGGNGTDSDTSLDDVKSRQDSTLGLLGTAGTRRTVYLSGGEESSPQPGTNNENIDDDRSLTHISDPPRSSTPHQDPVLVYNRVTAIVGGENTPPQSPSNSSRRKDKPPVKDKWYEYGCV